MKESDYEQLSRKDKLSRTQKKNIEWSEEDTLQLSDEHRVPTSTKKVSEQKETTASSKVLKTLFWLLRKLIAPIIMVVMLAVGLYVGYVVIAGQPSDEVFKFETWKHLWNLIFADS